MSDDIDNGSFEDLSYSRRDMLVVCGIAAAGIAAGLRVPSALGGTVGGAGLERASGTTIRFVNYTGWIGKGEYAAFKKASGNTVREIPMNAGRSQRVAADPSSTDMVLDPLGQGLGTLNAADLLETLDLSKIPNYKYVSQTFKTGLCSPKVAKAIPTDYGRTGILYRTDIVKEDVRSWKAFFKLFPKYSGKTLIGDDQNESLRNALLALGYNGNTRNRAEIEKGADLLISVKKHIGTLGIVDGVKRVVSGSVVLAMLEDWQGNQAIAENPKVPLKWVDPSDGAAGYLDAIGAVKGTKALDGIHQFLNFHLRPKVAANFCNTLSVAPLGAASGQHVNKSIMTSPITNPPARVVRRIAYWGYLGEAQRDWDDAWARFKAA